ncbi:GMC oxidoreductase [Vibrio sp. PP-XX7]
MTHYVAKNYRQALPLKQMKRYLISLPAKVKVLTTQVVPCKMGYDEMAVVDAELKVHGIKHLRVVDASIFPAITNGNLYAPTIMIAEKSSRHDFRELY